MMEKNLDKEYAGITGVPAFTKAAGELAYGEDSSVIKDNRVNEIFFYMILCLKANRYKTACYQSIYFWNWCPSYWC